VLIRNATADDVLAVATVHVRAWQAAYRGQIPDSYLDGLTVERRVPTWTRLISEAAPPATTLLVAEDERIEVVGFAHHSASRDDDAAAATAEVTSIYVSPDAWQRGIGGALLNAAETHMRRASYAQATLWVLDTNGRARNFYERKGWSPDGALKLDERGGFTLREVRYAKTLLNQ